MTPKGVDLGLGRRDRVALPSSTPLPKANSNIYRAYQVSAWSIKHITENMTQTVNPQIEEEKREKRGGGGSSHLQATF